MLVTFRTDKHESILFFGEVAIRLLKMMGHSGTIPGAILARDVPDALACLTKALANAAPEQNDSPESTVSIRHRAVPLIALLQAAVEYDDDVLWS